MVSQCFPAVGASIVNANQIMNLVIIVLSMASTAATVILSQYLGAEDKANSSRTCMVSILMITVVSRCPHFWYLQVTSLLYKALVCRRKYLMKLRCICLSSGHVSQCRDFT